MPDRKWWMARLNPGTVKPNWRAPVVWDALVNWWALDVISDTTRGDSILSTISKRDSQRSAAWIHALYKKHGLSHGLDVSTTGNVAYGFGRYDHVNDDSGMSWAAIITETEGLVELARDFHEQVGMMRRVWVPKPGDMPVGGDLVVHQNIPESRNGHTMLCVNSIEETGVIVVADVGSFGSGPGGGRRIGIGVRQLAMKKECVTICIRPSALDFSSRIGYARTRSQAEALLHRMKRSR